MAIEKINVGLSPDTTPADPVRTAFQKTNTNFESLDERVIAVEDDAGQALEAAKAVLQEMQFIVTATTGRLDFSNPYQSGWI